MIRYCRPNIDPEISLTGIEQILYNGWVSNGAWCENLERYFKKNCNVKYAFTCSNATTGLIMAVKAAGWENMNINIPAFTWPSTKYAVECNGGNYEYVDINKKSWVSEINISDVDAYYDNKKYILVDTFGYQTELDSLHNPDNVIIDAAHGFDLPGLGHRGLAEVVSFSHTKLVTGGEGGIILTNDDILASKLHLMRRMYGRMSEINAYIAIKSIFRYNRNKPKLEKIIDKYINELNFPFKTQSRGFTNNSVFAITFENKEKRDKAVKAMEDNDIEVKVYYEPLVKGLPNTDYVFDRILALPVYVEMIDKQDFIITTLNRSQE